METRTIYFDRNKAFRKIIAGAGIILAALVFRGFIGIFLFFIGGSFIFFARKSISKKPQLILSDEGLYVGFKFDKNISWKNIERVVVKDKAIDFRNLKFLELYLRVKSNGPSTMMKREFLLENLDTDPVEIYRLIQERLV